MQVLSSNELLRGRIRKERPFFYFSSFKVFFFCFFVLFFGSFVLFLLFFFSQCDSGQLDVHFSRGLLPAGRASNYTRERGWDFSLMNGRK